MIESILIFQITENEIKTWVKCCFIKILPNRYIYSHLNKYIKDKVIILNCITFDILYYKISSNVNIYLVTIVFSLNYDYHLWKYHGKIHFLSAEKTPSWIVLVESAHHFRSSVCFFFSPARDCTTFTLHDLTEFYVERVTVHRIKINDHSCFHNLWPNSKTKLKLKHIWVQGGPLVFRGPYAAWSFCV